MKYLSDQQLEKLAEKSFPTEPRPFDITDAVVGIPPIDQFLWSAQAGDSQPVKKMEKKYKNMAASPSKAGMGYSLMHRADVSPELKKELKKLDFKTYKKTLLEQDEDFSSSDRRRSLAALGALAGPFAFGALAKFNIKDNKRLPAKTLRKILDDKGLEQTKITRLPSSLGAYFDPGANRIAVGDDIDIALHEIGHASNLKAYKKVLGEKAGKIFGEVIYNSPFDYHPVTRRLGEELLGPLADTPTLGLAAVPLAYTAVTNKLKGKDEKSLRYKAVEEIEDRPFTVGAVAVSPKLIEEGSASARALKDAVNLAPKGARTRAALRSISKLGPAFGTYLSAALFPALAISSIRAGQEANEKIKPATKELFK